MLAAVGLILVARRLGSAYPIRDWLAWRFLLIWFLTAGWLLACVSAGHALLRRLPGPPLPLREHVLFSFASGVLVFTTGLFVIGVAGGLGSVAFVAWPLLMIASGAWPLGRLARRAWRRFRRTRPFSVGPRPSPVAYVLFAVGAVCVLLLYLNVMTPANLAYDSRWYHVAVAEHYAAAHAIRRFTEGWFPGALPQLATLLYTWAFLIPRGGLFMQIELAAHIEFVVFLATLAGIPLLVRWLLHGRRLPMSWAAFFLFPGIFVYDSTLNVAADHVLAFWAVPLALIVRRLAGSSPWSARDAVLFGAMAAGAALTKYQAIYMLCPIGVALVVTLAIAAKRGAGAAVLRGPAIAAGVLAVVTASHWLKNFVWYGNPVYPLLNGLFQSRPWNSDVDLTATLNPPGYTPTGTFAEKLLETAKSLVTFPFGAHDWWGFHKDWSVFGFLFSLFLPHIFLLPQARRIRVLAGATLAGVFIWYWTFHQDRYLQSLVPWMAAVVAAVIWRYWQAGWIGRLSVAPLVVLQILWGGDHPAFPTHAMSGSPSRISVDMIAAGYGGRASERYQVSGMMAGVGKLLPPGSKLLVHEQHWRLGVGVPGVSDARGNQGSLSYRRMRSPRELWQKLRGLGVTHLWWPSPANLEAWADEAVFYAFVTQDVPRHQGAEGGSLAALPETAPADVPYGPVAILGCNVAHRVTLPEVEKAIWTAAPPPSPSEATALAAGAGFILVEMPCRERFNSVDFGPFQLVTARHGWQTWVRRR